MASFTVGGVCAAVGEETGLAGTLGRVASSMGISRKPLDTEAAAKYWPLSRAYDRGTGRQDSPILLLMFVSVNRSFIDRRSCSRTTYRTEPSCTSHSAARLAFAICQLWARVAFICAQTSTSAVMALPISYCMRLFQSERANQQNLKKPEMIF